MKNLEQNTKKAVIAGVGTAGVAYWQGGQGASLAIRNKQLNRAETAVYKGLVSTGTSMATNEVAGWLGVENDMARVVLGGSLYAGALAAGDKNERSQKKVFMNAMVAAGIQYGADKVTDVIYPYPNTGDNDYTSHGMLTSGSDDGSY